MPMSRLPNRQWKKADGWVIRNLQWHGNSVVPMKTIRAMYRMYGDAWKETMEEILTRILREQGILDDSQSVWVYESSEVPGLWIARWY